MSFLSTQYCLPTILSVLLLAACQKSDAPPPEDMNNYLPVDVNIIKCDIAFDSFESGFFDEGIKLMVVSSAKVKSLKCSASATATSKSITLASSEIKDNLLSTQQFGKIAIYLNLTNKPATAVLGLTNSQTQKLCAYLQS